MTGLISTSIHRAFLIGSALVLIPLAASSTELEKISRPLHFRLDAPAATVFSSEEPPVTTANTTLAAEVEQRWPQLEFSPRLTSAARAYAKASLESGEAVLPVSFLQFLLNWAGCPETTVMVITVSTSEASNIDVLNHLGTTLDQSEIKFTHVGLARIVMNEEPFKWRWAVILTRRNIKLLENVPAFIPQGGVLNLRFRLSENIELPRIVVLDAASKLRKIGLIKNLDGDFEAVIRFTGLHPAHWLQILAQSAAGHVIAAQIPISIGSGDHDQTEWSGRTIPDESSINTVEERERLMVELVNQDRSHFGLEPLQTDERLTSAARAHSHDMHDGVFFDHNSPSLGNLPQRLADISYNNRAARENIARAETVHGAEIALWESPSHRVNILATDVTHIGIGIIEATDQHATNRLLITQIFADPITYPTEEQVLNAVLTMIQDSRTEHELKPLTTRKVLTSGAQRLSESLSSAGQLNQEVMGSIFDEIVSSGLKIRALNAEALTTETLGALRPPAHAAKREFDTFGIAVTTINKPNGAPTFHIAILYADIGPNGTGKK